MPRSPWPFSLRRLPVLVLLGAAPLLCGQSTTDTIYHLHGTVRDGVTNKPIGRALVAGNDGRLATMTDSQGHFAVDLSVPAAAQGSQKGTITSWAGPSAPPPGLMLATALTARRPGYLSLEQMVPITLDDSLNATDIAIRLMPTAVVSGQVSAAGVDSPQGVRVSLLRHSVIDGAYQWLPVGNHTVGTTGEFRFTNLQPGEYTVMTAEWAGGEPLSEQRTAITQQYPPDFLGDTRTLNSSAKLRLHYGSEEHAELHLRPATYFPIAVPVQNQPENSPINVRVAGADAMNGYQLGWNARDGAVEGSLPSGEYTLLLTSFGPQQGSASVPLTVANRPLEHAPVSLAAGGRIPIRVHTEFTQASQGSNNNAPPGEPRDLVQVYLRPLDSGGTFGGSSVRHNDDSGAALENVQPGVYTVHGQAVRGYISSMTSGGLDLMRRPLAVGDGGTADPIDVTLRDDGATVTGTVDTGSHGITAPGSTQNNTHFVALLLVSSDGHSGALQAVARSDGKFTIQNVAPGSYQLFAVSDARMLQIPFRDPQAMRAFAGKGTPVTVTAGQNATANVTAIDTAELDKE